MSKISAQRANSPSPDPRSAPVTKEPSSKTVQFARTPAAATRSQAVTIDEIAANDYSLTPGRYVGVAAVAAEDEDDFTEKLREIHDELAELNEKAVELAGRIASNFEELLG